MGALAVVGDSQIEVSRLGVLADEIRDHARQGQEHADNAKHHALAIGERLVEAKGLLPHGHFMKWAAEEFPAFKERHLRNFMTIGANRQRVADLGGDASLRMMLAAIKEPSRAVEQIQPGDPRTLVYAFNACTVFVKCVCGREIGGVMELTEGGNGQFSCPKCQRKYAVEARVKGGRRDS
ncbi:MAG TPA: DUF3102 domain-containing protein [Chloroflexota bacterium]|nr:DUF3102 domain-containing protein [Chloroflexota bacterium]